MVSLDKDKLSEYLKDYSVFNLSAYAYPNLPVGRVFLDSMSEEKHNNDHYLRMCRIYDLYVYLKCFSYYEDLQIDRLIDSEIIFNKEDIFVNKSDSKYFSNKQVIKFIRNAFNHSEKDKELYKISVNGKYLEVYLSLDNLLDKKGNRKIPVPFHVKLDAEQLMQLSEAMVYAGRHTLLIDFDVSNFNLDAKDLYNEIGKIKFIHYYFNKKLPIPVRDDIIKYVNQDYKDLKDKVNVRNKIESIIANEDYNKVTYDLFEEQKQVLLKDFTKLQELKQKTTGMDDIIENLVIYSLRRIIPLGMTHYEEIIYETLMVDLYLENPSNSRNNIKDYISNLVDGNPIYENYFDKSVKDDLLEMFDTNGKKIRLDLFTDDIVGRIIFPIIIALEYIIINKMDDEFININGKLIERERIRNSLVHGRWFVGLNENVEFYDTKSGLNNDYNFDFHETINIHDLVDYVKSFDEENVLKR